MLERENNNQTNSMKFNKNIILKKKKKYIAAHATDTATCKRTNTGTTAGNQDNTKGKMFSKILLEIIPFLKKRVKGWYLRKTLEIYF